jgi:VIT1/CCC1 family predicted Fe2+/Mn2+ transporter
MATAEHEHTREAIRARIGEGPGVSYLRERVYGGIDGTVTTFAIVAGVTGGDLSARVVLILGLANVIADGFSMAAGDYSSTKTENEEYARLRAVEERHVSEEPAGEEEEVREIFRQKGFSGEDLERAVGVITAERGRWIDTMMAEEHGQPGTLRAPLASAANTFAAFVVCGLMPLLPFLAGAAVPVPAPFLLSLGLAALVFFGIGSVKSRWTPAAWWQSGLETFAIGLGAAGIAYAVGHGLKTLV